MKAFNIMAAIGVFVIFSSCEKTYFSNPLPVDSESLYKIPWTYRGVWVEDTDSVIIGSNFIRSVIHKDSAIAKSIADTSSHVHFADNLIYIQDNASKLTGGFPYVLKNDTFYFTKRDVTEYGIATTLFLRKSQKGCFVNVSADNGWYYIYHLEKLPDNQIILTSFNREFGDRISNASIIYEDFFITYLNAKWSKKEIDDIVMLGCFSDTVMNLQKGNITYSGMDLDLDVDWNDDTTDVNTPEINEDGGF